MYLRGWRGWSAFVVLVCGGAIAAWALANKPPQKLVSDTPQTTPGGVTFTAPAGWTVAQDGTRVLLSGPEPELRLAIVQTKATTADAAVAETWSALRPDMKRPIKITLPLPGRYGWDERRRFDYETSPNERIVVYAIAYRRGNEWTVLAIESSEPAFGRRASQVVLVSDSLRPPGYVRESFAGKKAHPLDAARLKQITDFVEQSLKQTGTPGAAISLVQDGKVVFEGGFGVRELGKKERVDADTLFIIASNTKALTTLMLAKLVDEGKFRWDTPVTSVYPAFKLGDAATTKRVLMKHLVCACTGLPRQDFEWLFEFRGATPTTEMALLGTMQPTTSFGEVFQYSNLLASAAGFAGAYALWPERELGTAYDEAMRTRVFEPLGMHQTTFDFARALRGNHASPHSEDVNGNPAVATMDINYAAIPLRPAGGAWSSARELVRYVQMELALGKLPDGKRYISEENLIARRTPQVLSGKDRHYGMGLVVDTQYGAPVVRHGRSMIGFKSDMFFLPEQNVGGVILTNSDAGGLMPGPFVRRTLEVLFDGRPEAAEDLSSAVKARRDRLAKERERWIVPPDPTAVARLASRYRNAALGEIAVAARGAARVFDFGEWQSAVASRKNDDGTISFITIDPGVTGFEFVVGEHGGNRTLVLRDPQHEYVFAEQP